MDRMSGILFVTKSWRRRESRRIHQLLLWWNKTKKGKNLWDFLAKQPENRTSFGLALMDQPDLERLTTRCSSHSRLPEKKDAWRWSIPKTIRRRIRRLRSRRNGMEVRQMYFRKRPVRTVDICKRHKRSQQRRLWRYYRWQPYARMDWKWWCAGASGQDRRQEWKFLHCLADGDTTT